MSNSEPATTVLYRRATGMSMKVWRKDFATDQAADAWVDEKLAADAIELVEIREYTS